jgi:hypothetical protein
MQRRGGVRGAGARLAYEQAAAQIEELKQLKF